MSQPAEVAAAMLPSRPRTILALLVSVAAGGCALAVPIAIE